ncbi:MAG: ATP synthase F1 subunit delta [Deltaproteobacteria bacterium RIFCSPLOWO2_01_44_7]|nr:MAG: ATP synthase F1 subunit delta [Deltaproteobacteria bacterium RIFCSPHIGHO2_01_FULL_43_49]OGQ15181.1 MAG: ATP synthase F1 subunit delta [Deltaproteobacteria bacterium RIFCSPHIGHO2_02_FULL_44_53]OGQ27198.1 MAG: ATP synthase F1 subunit delta [Deltaproteobacteria bacterium RIFCSPHIGHO2_12_FULL_44_21]OGQ31698.1 MAG: ATP synthase F1 subunit delta [Deltaproteobacteria bacterium RIFCSPLOWO2_01_FULL_45_74]OGQ39841.1 MAG: ATP synthase F1 subunit delta [Deltaproteobacteria bacterium RIFCSPLOWO2_01_
MKERILADRYAKALVNLGTEEKSLERFREELGRFKKAIEIEPQLLKILSLREFSLEKREEILKELMLKIYLSPTVQNFFKFLLHRGRIALFPHIFESFEGQVREIERVVIAKVNVADSKTSKQLTTKLQKSLEKMTGRKVQLEIDEDPSLIGGLEVLLGDKIYDASIKGELERIKEQWI